MALITEIIKGLISFGDYLWSNGKKVKKGLRFLKKYKYVIYAVLITGLICNRKALMKYYIEFTDGIKSELHEEKLEKRDELDAELSPLLVELRALTASDRVLFLEYHNSKENTLGISFKHISLTKQVTKYGVPMLDESGYKDLNANSCFLDRIFSRLKHGDILVCNGESDVVFSQNFPGTREFLEDHDGSKRQAFLNIPGVNTSIGMIILEWMSDSIVVNDLVIKEEAGKIIPRVNALILSKR